MTRYLLLEDTMRKEIAIATAALLIVGLTSGMSWAGSSKRHTIEGFLLGTGVTLLGTAIIQKMSAPEPVVIHHRPAPCETKQHHGRWKTETVWVPAAYDTRWNPGHYSRKGRWVPGRYQEVLVAEGYWETRKVWVRHRRHR